MRAFSLDRDLALRLLEQAARALKTSRGDVARVVLFGSLARGDAVPGSVFGLTEAELASSPLRPSVERDGLVLA